MYLIGAKRRVLGDDSVFVDTGIVGAPAPSLSDVLTSPVNVPVSPAVLLGLGLFATAMLVRVTKKATSAVTRKGRAVRKALRS